MSNTTLYRVPAEGGITVYQEYQNSHRSAPFVWAVLEEKYLSPHPLQSLIPYTGRMEKVWDLWKNPDVRLEHRIVLTTTFDRVMVKNIDLSRLAAAMQAFAQDFPDGGHYPAMAVDILTLADDPTCYAVCWYQSSVVDNPWFVRDGEKWRAYDISKDFEHWFLFEELERPDEPG